MRWHHRCNGHGPGQTLGYGEGQKGLVCCSPWDRKKSDTTRQLRNNSSRDHAERHRPEQPCSGPQRSKPWKQRKRRWSSRMNESAPRLGRREPQRAAAPSRAGSRHDAGHSERDAKGVCSMAAAALQPETWGPPPHLEGRFLRPNGPRSQRQCVAPIRLFLLPRPIHPAARGSCTWVGQAGRVGVGTGGLPLEIRP